MPFKKIDIESEKQEFDDLLASSEDAKIAKRLFDEEYQFRSLLLQTRRERFKTQQNISDDSGLTQQVVSRLEKGSSDSRSPTLRTIIRYLDAIDCELAIKTRTR